MVVKDHLFVVVAPYVTMSMYVVKRGGRKESVHFDKITSRVSKLCYGLDPKHVDPVVISQKVIQGVYPGVTTTELDELAAQTAASFATQHPDCSILAARISVSNLQTALASPRKPFALVALLILSLFLTRVIFTYLYHVQERCPRSFGCWLLCLCPFPHQLPNV
jgi:hypothetical protein